MFGSTDRRHFLKHVAGAAAVTVPGLTFMTNIRAMAADLKKKNKSLIVLWMGGGPATIDIWDLKPGASTYGDWAKPGKTAVDGIQINDMLPTVAKQMKNLSIIRSLKTSEGDHDRGTFLMNTGRKKDPLIEYPSIGSVMSFYQAMDVEAMKHADIPSFISVRGGRVGPGFLGMKFAGFNVQNPGQPPENVNPAVNPSQMDRRKVLFESLESGFKTNVPGDSAKAHKDVYDKALNLVTSARKEVFNLANEPTALKEEYGANEFGRGCMLARKLVEAGVAAVEVSFPGSWDMHQKIGEGLARQLPIMDKGMGTLVKDLADRGKLKDTVILWMGDFGRTPKINQNAGRDHWPRCWSVVVGGGNIKGGIAFGSTTKDGTDIADNPVDVLNLYATVYKALGIDPTPQQVADVRDNIGHPYYIAGDKPKWIKELLV